MSMMGGGMMTPLGGAKVVQLTSDTDAFIVKDQDGFEVAKIDYKGNLRIKGGVSKI